LFGGGGSSVIISAKQENSVIIEHIIKALQNNWKAYLPVYEFCDWISIKNAVLKYAVLLLTGVVSISLFFMGIYDAVFNKKRRKILIFAIIFLAFAFYKFVCIRHNYFMWYIPPFTALAIIVSGTAINNLLQTKFKFLSFAFAAFLIFMWVFPLPFLFGVEKQAQIYIENGVRKKVGERLNSIMGKDAVVGLEPLGYIGYYARNKTTFDNPGLSSKIVVEMLKQNGNPPWSFALSYICRFLKPDFMVLRPDELDRIKVQLKTFDGDYQFMETIESQYNEFVCGPLLLSRAQDATFYIFKRNPDAQ
jgi:hypothetical protein